MAVRRCQRWVSPCLLTCKLNDRREGAETTPQEPGRSKRPGRVPTLRIGAVITAELLRKLFPAADEIPPEHRPRPPLHQTRVLINGELRPWEGESAAASRRR
jgi:hypothetical protein